jgi:group I intron endonuclease
MKQSVIYKIINSVNNKFYIGSTNNQYERFRTHRNKLRNNKHHTKHLQAAWNKYGEDAFIFHVIEIIPEDASLQEAEDVWLTEWVGKPECYNHGMRSGAPWRGGNKEDHPNYGKQMAEATKQLIRNARHAQDDPRLGKKHTEATKQIIREKKLANPTRAWLGKTRDEATRKKIGDAQRGVAKAPRVYTPEGLERARANMLKNASKQEINTIDAVIAKFPLETQQRYDFTNAVYTGALSRITGCVCHKHGVFSQYAAQLRKGSGCPACGAAIRGDKKSAELKAKWSDPKARTKMMEARIKVVDTPHIK